MALPSFDEQVESMLRADDVRASLVPGERKMIYLVDKPWTMKEDPWVVVWNNEQGNECAIYLMEPPVKGDKYAMFGIYDEIDKRYVQYVFILEKYHSTGE
ncbi:hypothetical protein [Salmonella phage SSBI34]|nr:hypothetical protein [Salmonella phage SSBI34]